MSEDWSAVDEFLNAHLVPEDPALTAALADSAAAGLPPIAVAPNQGKLLHILARLRGARTILEVGTLGGYSTIVRKGAVADARSTDPNVTGTRQLFARLRQERRVTATALQTVGIKGWDGLIIALVDR
jgi:predicted O-methyltransferase YrrM